MTESERQAYRDISPLVAPKTLWRLPNGDEPEPDGMRRWTVVGPMGSDHISYDPPDIDYAEQIIVEVVARNATEAKVAAERKLRESRRAHRDLMDHTRYEGRAPYAAMIAVEMKAHDCEWLPWTDDPEQGPEPACAICLDYADAIEAAIAKINAKYQP